MSSLFPNLPPKFYATQDREVLQRMESFYAEAITLNQAFWGEADTDTRFEAGDQTLWNEIYGNLHANRRRQFHFNRIRRVINMITGHQRRNRKSTIVIPVENADQETADQFSKIMMWLNQQEGVLETISNSFHGSLVTGMNFLHVWMDYRSDPINGNIKVDNCHYNSFLVDPYFRKADLSDCKAIWKRSYLTQREAISLLPDRTDEILSLYPNNDTAHDNKFQFLPENYNYGYSNLLTYDEFYYRDYRTQKLLADTQTGETMEWNGSEEKMKEFLNSYPEVTVIEGEVPTTRLAIVIQGRVMYDGPNPLGIDRYPLVPTFAYYVPQMPYYPYRIQGVVRGLRDAQFLFNRRQIINLDILESQINSGWKMKENALVNPKDIFLEGQGRRLVLKTEAAMSDVEKIPPPALPPSLMEMSKTLADEITQISGVNEELLGSAIDEKAGILSMLRQGAGLTTLQILFDQLDYTQKVLGKIIIDCIQANFTPGKVKKIINEEPTQQFYNKAFGKYDAAVEEGLNTSTQRQMQFAQLLQLREVGVPIPDEILLESATLQQKNKLVEAIQQQNQQKQQQEQAQAQLQMQQTEAQINLANARAVADEGLGHERMSRIAENQALAEERKAEATKDRYSALYDLARSQQLHKEGLKDKYAGIYDLAKAVKALEGATPEDIAKLQEIANLLDGEEQQVSEPFEDILNLTLQEEQQQPFDVAQQVQQPFEAAQQLEEVGPEEQMTGELEEAPEGQLGV